MGEQVVVLASDNKGKIAEFGALFVEMPVSIVAQGQFGISTPEETGSSFAENAHLKAEHAARESGLPALADDSGLEVDAIDGRPGLYSARYAGMQDAPERERDLANMRKLLAELKKVPPEKRSARFVCALALVWPPQAANSQAGDKVCVGVWEGSILDQARGQNGFGYDPVFYVAEKKCSAGELLPEEKHRISHRARAWEQLLPHLARCGLNR